MSLKLGDFVEDLGAPGIALGVGAVVLAPFLARSLKPVAKATIKGATIAYEKTKGIVAEAGEVFEDLVAEAQAELAEEQAKKLEGMPENQS